MNSVLHPIPLTPLEAFRLGFTPDCVALPATDAHDGPFFVVGLDRETERMRFSNDSYRIGPRGIRVAGKTCSLVGMIGSIDMRHASNRRMPQGVVNSVSIDAAIKALRARLVEKIGRDVTDASTMPSEFKPLNAAMDYLARGRKDHARLLLRWSWLFGLVGNRPDILDRAVRGESLWDLVSSSLDPEVISFLRSYREFTTGWTPPGETLERFSLRLMRLCKLLPEGYQRPASAEEARSAIELSAFYEHAFDDLPQTVRSILKAQALSNRKAWLEGDEQRRIYWRAYGEGRYARDYVGHIYRSIILEGFRLNGIDTPSDQQLCTAAVALFGKSPSRLKQSSKQWHDWRLFGEKNARLRLTARWEPAIDRIETPGGLSIVPLDTAESLHAEGSSQLHCIFTGLGSCAEGRQRVASVRSGSSGAEQTLSTFRFTTDGSKIAIREHRAKMNADPTDEAQAAVGWFERECNGGAPPFRLNLSWPPVREEPKTALDQRAQLLAYFDECKGLFPKRIRKAGFDGLLAICGGSEAR